jgi:type IV pilus assembly protein PilN
VVDAKTIALHSAIKNNPAQNFKSGTLLIEIGLENNYIMVIGEDRPRIIDVPISATQRSALIGSNDSPEEVAGVVSLYKNAIDNIINQRGRGNNPLYINDIYVSSSLPLVNNFISKLGEEFTNCNVSECNIFDHLIIPDDFMINKQSAEHNISAWAGAISMAVMPWKNRKEEWIEIRKSPSYGIKYIRHYGKGWNLKDLSTKIGNFNPYAILAIGRKIGFTSLAFYVNGLALATFAAAGFMMLNSYKELTEQRATLSVNDVAFSDVVAIYDEKSGQIAAMQDALEQMQSVEDAAIEFTKEENQQYVLSMYSYLDNVLQQGVWLKELTFTAPTTIEIEGRSMDDNGVTKFLGTLDNSKMFANMALKHIQSISELDLYAKNSVYMKSFFMKGHLSETLPDAYLYKPSMVAGDIHHGS